VSFEIRPYEERDERGWLICRLLSFFDTAFFDADEREKERLVKAFAHYTGDRREEIRSRYQRVHDDVLYEKQLRWVRRPARSPARARPALCIDRETDD
jgi:hypothetical protein